MATKPHPPGTEPFGVGVRQRVNFADDDNPKDDDKDEKMIDESLDVSAVVKAIESGAISVADMDAILAAIQSQGATEEPAADEPAPAAAPGAEAMTAQRGTMSAQMAAMQGKLDALETKDVERDTEDKCRTDVAEALQRLAGRPMGADLEARLMAFHQSHGPEAFKAYIDSMAETFGIVPSAEATGSVFNANAGQTPAVAMKYMEGGGSTADVDRAANFARQWQIFKDRGATAMTQERYVEINMNTQQELEA